MKYIFTVYLLLLSTVFGAAELVPLDEDATPEAMTRALEKARQEFKEFKLEQEYLQNLKLHYESHLTDIIIENFVKYYLAGTTELHELLALAQALEENETTLIPLPDEPDFEKFNREFLHKLTAYYYALTTHQ
jgi:hypothetical protein